MEQKTGLVLEGGGMRGIYTAGVLDLFMDQGVIAVEGTPQQVFSSENARMREFLGKFHQGA